MGQHDDCRMYEERYPEVDDVVMVTVKSIAEMGAYVSLLEYNGIEGMILLSELSRRRIRSISKLIKVGRQEPVMVLRVDKEKGYIDLSKRRVSPEDIARCEETYNKSKMVHSIMRHVAETTPAKLTDLYTQFGWPCYKSHGHAFDAFKTLVQDPETFFQKFIVTGDQPLKEGEVAGELVPVLQSPEVREALIKNIQRRMTPQPLKIRADIELTCFQYDGVLHIKEAMRAGESGSKEECIVKVKLVAPPLYVLTTQTLEKELGIATVGECIELMQKSIEARKGKLIVKEAPRAVSERDDRLLAEKMDALAKAQEEVDGDDSDGEQDETMGDIDVEAMPALSM
uniref:S1 motif domain-containing protein n=1 Tax=Pyramimonas obovata TaxID=1411642 RepID=A0A7S0RLS3_9CHLO|mmetsp:Transcript_37568/g.81765  ORF Transcript_37568/g.81765 Transcript_37568/m.81765 type:complete len:341 (+) Transcript_37568:221-1243(+)|eukprot:CAMPEP_0118935166 /NCGR_PEP_ID=MMETSP1169-20130426/15044_1 /TAXON_ID=36882 /ORGANISM="Pyramimonas obovata, Strain CCMP722" /LENGTH=340 /DNA_ID=CAMNT_0006878159 /DNA_START=221 /DNA_END=1243 /DNA_ORIENTATION=+